MPLNTRAEPRQWPKAGLSAPGDRHLPLRKPDTSVVSPLPSLLAPGLNLGLWSLPLAWMPRFPSSRGQQKMPKAPEVFQQARLLGSLSSKNQTRGLAETEDPSPAKSPGCSRTLPPSQSPPCHVCSEGLTFKMTIPRWAWGLHVPQQPGIGRRGLWLPRQTTQAGLGQAWLRQGRPRLQRPCSEELSRVLQGRLRPCTQHTHGSTRE